MRGDVAADVVRTKSHPTPNVIVRLRFADKWEQ
jgi:hypothetical protein